jgi:hypothetical protein
MASYVGQFMIPTSLVLNTCGAKERRLFATLLISSNVAAERRGA